MYLHECLGQLICLGKPRIYIWLEVWIILLLLLLSHFICVQLCATPEMGSLPGSSVPGILQARTLEWVAISFSNAWKWKVKGKSLSSVQLFETPWTAAYQAPPSMGFSRQEYWSGVPLPSPWIILSLINWKDVKYNAWCLTVEFNKLLLVTNFLCARLQTKWKRHWPHWWSVVFKEGNFIYCSNWLKLMMYKGQLE